MGEVRTAGLSSPGWGVIATIWYVPLGKGQKEDAQSQTYFSRYSTKKGQEEGERRWAQSIKGRNVRRILGRKRVN